MGSYLEDFWDQRKKQKKLTPEEKQKQEEKIAHEQRDRAIYYKKFFGDEVGKGIMTDLLSKFIAVPETESPITLARASGRRDVVDYLLTRTNVKLEDLDKILRGEQV